MRVGWSLPLSVPLRRIRTVQAASDDVAATANTRQPRFRRRHSGVAHEGASTGGQSKVSPQCGQCQRPVPPLV